LEYETALQALFGHLNEIWPWLVKIETLTTEADSFGLCVTNAVIDDLLKYSPITRISDSTRTLREILHLEKVEIYYPIAKTFPSSLNALANVLSSFNVRFASFSSVVTPWQTNRLLKIDMRPVVALQLTKHTWPNAFTSAATAISTVNACANGGVNPAEICKNLTWLSLTVETFSLMVNTAAKFYPMLPKIIRMNNKLEVAKTYLKGGTLIVDYLVRELVDENGDPVLTKDGLIAVTRGSKLSELKEIIITLKKILKAVSL
jgi:hypothetical protein